MHKQFITTIAALLVLLKFVACTDNSLAGRSGVDETSNGIQARIFDQNGKPQVGALVIIRPENFVATAQFSHNPSAGIVNTVTNQQGKFQIDSLPNGRYRLEIRSADMLALYEFTIPQSVDDFSQWLGDSLVTQQAASLQGRVQLPEGIASARVVLVGLEYLVHTDSTGSFLFPALPAGSLQIISFLPDTPIVIAASPLNLQPGDSLLSVVVDPITRELNEWQHSLRVIVNTRDSARQLSGALKGFPLLVRLEGEYFPSAAQSGGSDLRVINSHGNPLPFEIAWWEPSAGKAQLWILPDSIAPNDSQLVATILWGIQGVLSAARGGEVFDTALHWAGVWHLQKTFAGNGGTFFTPDATPAGHHARILDNQGVFPDFSLSGAWFDGDWQGVGVHPFPLNFGRENHTLEFWARIENEGAVFAHRSWEADSWNHHERVWYLGKNGSSVAVREGFQPTLVSWGPEYNNYTHSQESISLNTWVHLAHRRESINHDSSRYEWFLNGAPLTMPNAVASDEWDDLRDSLYIARRMFGRGLQGFMRHFHISSIARTNDWIRMSYQTQLPGNLTVLLFPQ